jgi:hypothetical protein
VYADVLVGELADLVAAGTGDGWLRVAVSPSFSGR